MIGAPSSDDLDPAQEPRHRSASLLTSDLVPEEVQGHPGVRIDANGRYLVGGFSFSSLETADEYANRSLPPSAPRTSGAAPAPRAASTAPFEGETASGRARSDAISVPDSDDQAFQKVSGHPGIRIDINECYRVGGFTFASLDDAVEYAKRSLSPAKPIAAEVPVGRAASPVARAAPEERAGREPPRWIAESIALRAGGVGFTAALVHYGTPQRYEDRHDKSRIDPALSVDPRGDPDGRTLVYSPSYRDLDPRARATYLRWLDGGRSDPSVPIGFVFLFFYGLEQRLLADDARDDAPAIFNEARRLLQIYGESGSFSSYVARFIALSSLFEEQEDSPPTLEGARNFDFELPLDVRIRLGKRLRDGLPFTSDDALRWVLALPDTYLRTSGERCFGELRELWTRRFLHRHPVGLSIRRPRKSIQHEYRAASGAFTMDLAVAELPDVAGTTAPLAELRTMLDGCMEDLSAYSRLLGREPEARGLVRADMLLPRDLLGDRSSLAACRSRLGAIGAATVTLRDLALALEVVLDEDGDKVPAAANRQMGAVLDALDYGFEPDRRYGPVAALRRDSAIAIFPSTGGCAVEHERPEYLSARAMVDVGMLAAAADGRIDPSEVDLVESRIRAMSGLGDQEVARLIAYARCLGADPPKVRTALKRLAEAPTEARTAMAAMAIESVLADGRIEPSEVKFLETLHAALAIPVATLYSNLHRGSADDQGPVEVTAGREEALVPIPKDEVKGSAVAIDAARLARIRSETSQVSALLASIFVEEPGEAPQPTKRATAAGAAFPGLDGPHSELLARILVGALPRPEFEALAGELRLMPDGAIETINEWGFDRYDEPVLEDGETIAVAEHLLQQIKPKGVSV